MKTEQFDILPKTTIGTTLQNSTPGACCGGTPATNPNACCKLDEEKKSQGESGCGCNTASAKTGSGGCC